MNRCHAFKSICFLLFDKKEARDGDVDTEKDEISLSGLCLSFLLKRQYRYIRGLFGHQAV